MHALSNRFLIFLLSVILYSSSAHAKSILTCPKDLVLLTNNHITSVDRNWVFNTTYQGTTADDFVTITKQTMEQDKGLPVKNKIYADLFSVSLGTKGSHCIYLEKKSHRLLYLDTVNTYTPYNIKNWNKWNSNNLCGNKFPENGKIYPIDYCQFTKNQ